MAFTKEQLQAINEEGKNIIVSAGAGSGKTAVLTERVIRKLKEGTDVDKLLVLTFTNEAAAEMKSRIRNAIIKNNLDNQLNLLDSSYITTFDSYALSLVKKYHYLLNIKQNISIIDKNVILLYKNKIIDDIFESMYGNFEFDNLINTFCQKDDKVLKDYLLNLSDKLELLIDKRNYLDNYLNNYYSDESIDKYISEYLSLIEDKITELKKFYEEFTYYINDKLSDKLSNYFNNLFNGNNYDEYKLFTTLDIPKFIGVDEAGKTKKEVIKEKIEEIKKLLRFENVKDMKEKIKKTYSNVSVIINIINKLDEAVTKYKKEYDIYEFNDIALMAVSIVKDNKDIQEELKNYFNEIMIDEYQDTSSIQEEFIKYISNNNVYMVGDIKQSIYRFRNANPYIFQEKYNKYSKQDGGIKIDLLKNFRSRKETLFNINEIFNLIMDDKIGNAKYQESHNMIYGNIDYDLEDTKVNNSLEIYNYDNEEKEFKEYEKELFIIAEDILTKIKNNYQVFDKETKKLRKIKYSDICIITDRNKYLDIYKKILEYKKIPSTLYKDEVLTNDDDILVIKNLINLVYHVKNNIYDNKFKYLYTSVARSFLFSYNDDMIYQILKNNTFKEDKIIEMAKEIDLSLPLLAIINQILNNFNVYDRLTILSNIDSSLARIDNLINVANSLNDLNYNITEFIEYFENLINSNLEIKYSINTKGEDAVKIMNIHKSKGLEFSLCYFSGMNNKFMIKEISDKILFNEKLGIIIPYMNEELEDTIIKDLYVSNYYYEEISEKIRLFYVALTRCREKMIIVTSLDEESEKSNIPVRDEIRIKYRSFLDILNSVAVIDKYVVNKDANYTHEYEDSIINQINEAKEAPKINKYEIKIDTEEITENHFSMVNNELLNLENIKLLEYGTKIHEELEYADFKQTNNKYIKNLLEKIDNNFLNIYREYEFIYEDNYDNYHGIIDLMLEYEDSISIIDYKLKDITKEEYIKQLKGYKEYIEKISNKKVSIYLYSILDNKLEKID